MRAACALLVLMAASASARAEPRSLVVDDTGDLICVSLVSCDRDASCRTGEFGDYCGDVGSIGMRCHFGLDSFLCCDAPDDCMTVDAAGVIHTGTCAPLPSGVSVSGGSRICLFGDPGETTYCPGLGEMGIVQCATDGDGVPVSDWSYGDCDRDGYINEAESIEGCDACDPASTPPCTPRPDGGTGIVDGGIASVDGGPRADAGSVRRDGGRVGPGPGAVPGVSFRGGGGCVCGVTRGAGSGWPGLLASGAIAGVAAAARRRRRRVP